MELNIYKIKTIALIGDSFFKTHNDTIFDAEHKLNKIIYKNDWWLSFQLFFKHMVLRGRKDSVSMGFYYKFIDLIIGKFQFQDKITFESYKSLRSTFIGNDLEAELKLAELNNPYDRIMFDSALAFIDNLNEYNGNITNFVLNENLIEVHTKLKLIKFIGDKLACFYLRNIYKLFDLEDAKLKNNNIEELKCLLPIDTWIGQICYLTGIISTIDNEAGSLSKKFKRIETNNSFIRKENNDEDKISSYISDEERASIKVAMIRICTENNINPMDFNQGAWCVGFYSLPITLSLINETNLENVKFDFITKT